MVLKIRNFLGNVMHTDCVCVVSVLLLYMVQSVCISLKFFFIRSSIFKFKKNYRKKINCVLDQYTCILIQTHGILYLI